MFDVDNATVIVWGLKNVYHTHSHIHEGFFRALQYMGRKTMWLDELDDIEGIDFSGCLFITNHDNADPNGYWPCPRPKKHLMPVRDDCFYVIHGMNDDPVVRERFANNPRRLSWNVFHDFSAQLGQPKHDYPRPPVGVPLTESVYLAEDTPFYPLQHHMDFRWATDLTPPEIARNKPARAWNPDSNKIWWVGTVWFVNQKELSDFADECAKNRIEFSQIGAGQKGVVSVEENIRLVRESYFAPAISGTHHLTEGYAPCRIFKNISYGQFGVTNSKRVNDIFGGKLIFNPDVRKLFYDARERLASMDVKELHALMDEVAHKHTYLNRLNSVFTAVKYLAT